MTRLRKLGMPCDKVEKAWNALIVTRLRKRLLWTLHWKLTYSYNYNGIKYIAIDPSKNFEMLTYQTFGKDMTVKGFLTFHTKH